MGSASPHPSGHRAFSQGVSSAQLNSPSCPLCCGYPSLSQPVSAGGAGRDRCWIRTGGTLGRNPKSIPGQDEGWRPHPPQCDSRSPPTVPRQRGAVKPGDAAGDRHGAQEPGQAGLHPPPSWPALPGHCVSQAPQDIPTDSDGSSPFTLERFPGEEGEVAGAGVLPSEGRWGSRTGKGRWGRGVRALRRAQVRVGQGATSLGVPLATSGQWGLRPPEVPVLRGHLPGSAQPSAGNKGGDTGHGGEAPPPAAHLPC